MENYKAVFLSRDSAASDTFDFCAGTRVDATRMVEALEKFSQNSHGFELWHGDCSTNGAGGNWRKIADKKCFARTRSGKRATSVRSAARAAAIAAVIAIASALVIPSGTLKVKVEGNALEVTLSQLDAFYATASAVPSKAHRPRDTSAIRAAAILMSQKEMLRGFAKYQRLMMSAGKFEAVTKKVRARPFAKRHFRRKSKIGKRSLPTAEDHVVPSHSFR